MGSITDGFASVYRDYQTDGVPSSGPNDPAKSDIRVLGSAIDSAVLNAVAGIAVYSTEAALLASSNVPAGTRGRVFNDSTAANNTVYITKTGNAADYVVDTDFLNAVASVVQPLVNQVNAAAASIMAQSAVLSALSSITTQVVQSVGANFPTSSTLTPTLAVIIGQTPGGTVTNLTLPVTATGAINVLILTANGSSSFTVVSKTALTASTTGAAVSFPLSLVVQTGQYLGIELPSGGASIGFSSGTSSNGLAIFSAASGTQTWGTVNGASFAGQFTLQTSIPAIPSSALSPTFLRAVFKPVVTFATGFGTSAPSSWTFGATWTHPANGALSPAGASDMSVYALAGPASLLHDEERTHRFWFIPQAAGVKACFGLARADHGTLAIVDDGANLLSFAVANGGTTGGDRNTSWTSAPTVLASVTLPALTAGREYLVQLQKNRRVNTVSITDLRSGTIIATLTDGSNNGVVIPQSGYQFGSPIAVVMAGQVLLRRFAVSSTQKQPRALFLGDSLTEAPYDGSVTVPQRWGQIVKDQLGGRAVIAGLSGCLATEIAPLLAYEIPALAPDIIIAGFGTNDASNGSSGLSNLQTNYQNLIAYCQTNNILLAVARLPPSARATDPINAYIDTLPSSVRRVRWDYAMTTGNDGVTRNTAYSASDNVHWNAAGHAAVAARTLVDLPELLDVSA